jgi:hypothetical protein
MSTSKNETEIESAKQCDFKKTESNNLPTPKLFDHRPLYFNDQNIMMHNTSIKSHTHINIATNYNSDFDGDEMNIFLPESAKMILCPEPVEKSDEKLDESVEPIIKKVIKPCADDVWGDDDNIQYRAKGKSVTNDSYDKNKTIDDIFDEILNHYEETALERSNRLKRQLKK